MTDSTLYKTYLSQIKVNVIDIVAIYVSIIPFRRDHSDDSWVKGRTQNACRWFFAGHYEWTCEGGRRGLETIFKKKKK